MLLSLVWMLFGVCFYSFVIGNYSSIISSNIQIQASIQLRIKGLAELAKKANIPMDLLKKIKKFIENNFEAIYNQDDEAMLVRMLPPSLRDEVIGNTYGEVIQNIRFFKELRDPDFLWKLLPLLRPIKLEKGDVLYWRGDHSDDCKLGIILPVAYSIFHFERNYQTLLRQRLSFYQICRGRYFRRL
jgi:hypothetical protein